jgi:zinc protease
MSGHDLGSMLPIMARPGPTIAVPEIHLAEVDGIPCFWAEAPGPTTVALAARVGIADETLVTHGITHLVEHAAIPARSTPGVAYDGTVEMLTTQIWARGEPEAASGFVSECASATGALDPADIRRERGILRAEEALRGGPHPVQLAASLRFGTLAHGLVGYPEYATQRVTDEEVIDWGRSRFSRGNTALWAVGEPPEIELGLAAGALFALPDLEPIPYIGYPSVFGYGQDGRITASFLCERSWQTVAAYSALYERLRERLRFQMGTTYSVDFAYEPLTANVAHLVFSADCEQHRVMDTRDNLLAVVEDFADIGPTDEELDLWRDELDRDDGDPVMLPSRLRAWAHDHLLGRPIPSLAEYREERERLTVGDVRAAFADAMSSMLLFQPHDAPFPGERFEPYPLDSPYPIAGRHHLRRRPRPWKRRAGSELLVAGAEGVMIHTDHVWGTRFADCTAVLRWPDSGRGLYSRDGFYLMVSPDDWSDGGILPRLIDEATSDELIVEMGDRADS